MVFVLVPVRAHSRDECFVGEKDFQRSEEWKVKMVIGSLDYVSPSDNFKVTLTYSAFLPEFFLSESGVRQALQNAGYNVKSVDVDTLAGFRKVIAIVSVPAGGHAGEHGKAMAAAISGYFASVWSAAAEKFEVLSTLSTEPVVSTQTTVSLVAVAVIVVVGGILLLRSGVIK